MDKDEVGEGKSSGNKTNLSNPSTSKRSTKASYLTSKGVKKWVNNPKKTGDNIKNCVKAVGDFHYLIPNAKKAINYLRHAFTQAPILQHFDPKWHIRIETNASGYAIGGVLN